MTHSITAIVACLRRFWARREGNTAIIFGLAAIPVVVAAGMAVDVTRAYTVKMRMSSALDAAILAVGSQASTNQTVLQTAMQNYFTANFPSNGLVAGTPTIEPIPPSGQTPDQVSLSQTTVSYLATAKVNMTFMQLVGWHSITVTATAQTHRGTGYEVALVLDNTGSMLCGNSDLNNCATGVVSSDTDCSNTSDTSRICMLRRAAVNFINTMKNSLTPNSGQLYVGVVPYVTTVNIGNTLCTAAGVGSACSHVTKDACSGDFTDQYGNIVGFSNGVIGNLSSSTTGTPPANRKVLSLANNPGTTSDVTAGMQIRAVDPDGGTTSPAPFAAGTTVTSTTDGATPHQPVSMLLSNGSSTSVTGQILQVGFTGTTVSGSPVISNIVPPLNTWNDFLVTPAISIAGMVLTDNPTSTSTSIGYWSNGTAMPANNAVLSYDVNANTITMCKNALATKAIASPATFWMSDPIPYDPTPNTGAGGGTTGASTESWMGCVIEPTSSNENTGAAGVLNSATSNPDTSEPAGGWPNWYAFWWRSGSGGFNSNVNAWTPKSGGILGQTNLTEVLGQETTDWNKFSGPNQGCPVPMLPLQDASTTAGQNAVLNTINAMWPRDAGGTQVHIGMIWGWRMLSPNGPFGQNNGHPLSYADQTTQAWKKAIILMTDGQEEWPNANQDTGLGYVSDGKIGTTSISTAVTNLNTRLQTVCNNMKASGHFVIYTIGLGSGAGASNTQLQQCATAAPAGGFFAVTDTAQLDAAFQSIANSLLTLRLSQ